MAPKCCPLKLLGIIQNVLCWLPMHTCLLACTCFLLANILTGSYKIFLNDSSFPYNESEMYGRELVDLRKERRWEFLNTFFSVSEAVMFMQVCTSVLFKEKFTTFYVK